MRAAAYCRVSSLQQKESQTIESQLRVLPEFVASRGWTLAGTYVDDGRTAKAGHLERREAFQRLIADAQAGRFDVVAVVDLDRLTRSEDVQERGYVYGIFQRAKVRIAVQATGQLLDLNSSDGDLLAGIFAWVAAEENRKRREKAHRGREQSILRGRKPAGQTPYGLAWTHEDGWAEDEAEAAIVREIFSRVASGESARSVGMDLERRQVTPPRRGRWYSGVPRIIRKTTYRGQWEADRGRFVSVPPLVDEDTWDAANASMSENRLRGLRTAKRVYFCDRGLAVCELCGERIGAAYLNLNDSTAYYYCNQRRRPRPHAPRCALPMRRSYEVDGRLWFAVERALLGDKFVKRAAELRQMAAADDPGKIRAELKRLAGAEAAVLERFTNGLISDAAMDAHVAKLTAKRAALEQRLASASAGPTDVRALLEELRARLAVTTPAEQRELVRTLIPPKGVTIGSTRIMATIIVGSTEGSGRCSFGRTIAIQVAA